MGRSGRFSGRVAAVTGGAGGLGKATAAGFAAEGAAVAVIDLNGEAAEQAAAELRAEGALAVGGELDVRDPEATAQTLSTVHRRLGGLHFLATLAGGSLGTPRETDAVSPEDLDLVVDVNLKGTFYCCQAAAPYLAEAGDGAIVTVSSVGARQASPVTGVPYAASKAAIGGLTRRLARELGGAGVRVNAVAPGLFLTERLRGMYEDMPEERRREVLDAIPLNRFPDLREAVDPILFLCSDEASYITGVVLDVNGGRYMPP